MQKRRKWLAPLLACLLVLPMLPLIRDRQQLGRDLIRLHITAESDSREDQAEKLAVRDGILRFLAPQLEGISTAEQAHPILEAQLETLESQANRILKDRNSPHTARVRLTREAFPVRFYDTFALPAGVYESLRITVGSGRGHNWWCVVFPELCLPGEEDVSERAEQAGLSDSLTDTMARKGEGVRFFLLELLGQLENRIFARRESFCQRSLFLRK